MSNNHQPNADRDRRDGDLHRRRVASDSDQGPLGAEGFRICAELTFELGLCEVFRTRKGFKSLLSKVAAKYRRCAGDTYRQGLLPLPVQDLLLRRMLLLATADHFRKEVEDALKGTSPERQEDLFHIVRGQTEAPAGIVAGDPGAFFDPAAWNFDEVPADGSQETFARLGLYQNAMLWVMEGLRKGGLSHLNATIQVAELRRRWQAGELDDEPRNEPVELHEQPAGGEPELREAQIEMLAEQVGG